MANIRVRDFAKDLGKENKELLSILKAQGIEKTAASNIDDAQQKMILAILLLFVHFVRGLSQIIQ